MNKVENLKKITLSIRAGTSQDAGDLKPKYPVFEFIFGLGPQGMSPFEYELADKAAGERIVLYLKKKDFHSFFEHLDPPLMELFDGRDGIYLQINIDAVTSAANREIVEAMAAMAAHGGSRCDCGCGCGG